MESADLSEHIEDLEGLGVVYPAAEQRLASDPSLWPGINCCAVCAVPEHKKGEECVACARIWYCSRRCRQQDAEVHEGLLCRALWQAGRDDDAEEQLSNSQNSSGKKGDKKNKNKKKKKQGQGEDQEQERKEETGAAPAISSASQSRIRGEVESYPKTLQLALMTHQAPSMKGRTHGLVVHVIGASRAELPSEVSLEAWRNALVASGVASKKKQNELHFIGGELADVQFDAAAQLHGENVQLHLWPTSYESFMQRHAATAHPPDLVCFYNPGFTCPDYDWAAAISALIERWPNTPYFATTNTKDEMLMDLDWLQGELGLDVMPTELGGTNDDAFVGDNPAAGRRIRQSGTMANDVYIKNRWMYGGVLSRPQPQAQPAQAKRKVAREDDVKRKEPKRK